MTAYDTYQTYQNEGAAAAAKTLAVDGALTVAGLGAAKLAKKAYKAFSGPKTGSKGASGELTTASGSKYSGNSTGSSASGGDARAPMNSKVQEALGNVQKPSRSHGHCCEIDAMNKALNAGDDISGAKMGSVKLNESGRVLPACSTCREVKKALDVE